MPVKVGGKNWHLISQRSGGRREADLGVAGAAADVTCTANTPVKNANRLIRLGRWRVLEMMPPSAALVTGGETEKTGLGLQMKPPSAALVTGGGTEKTGLRL